jgi:hypothetical protein
MILLIDNSSNGSSCNDSVNISNDNNNNDENTNCYNNNGDNSSLNIIFDEN